MYAWSLDPSKYVREAVNNCVKHLRENFEGKYSWVHEMRESIAMGESITSHIPTIFNPDDILTKKCFVQKKRGMAEGVLYDVFD